MAAAALINLAMSAVFGYCVPHVSDGAIAQAFPADLLQPLTEAEKVDLLGEGGFRGHFWQVKTDDGVLAVSVEDGYCRVISGTGNSGAALTAFREALQKAGGHEGFPNPRAGEESLPSDGWIAIGERKNIIVVFMLTDENAQGFSTSAFLIENRKRN